MCFYTLLSPLTAINGQIGEGLCHFTYRILKEAFSYKNVVNQFCVLYLTHQNIIPEENLQLLKIIKDLLEVFSDATLFFSGVYYPTSTQALTHFYEMSLVFKRNRDEPVF